MGDGCQIILEKQEYSPGETMNGRVECNFASENKIKGIRVKISGGGRVSWKHGFRSKFSYRRAEEIYLDMESEILSGEITAPAGLCHYPFQFVLPTTLPPTTSAGDPNYLLDVAAFFFPRLRIPVYYGIIAYVAQVTVVRNGITNLVEEKPFKIISTLDLNTIGGLDQPVEVSKAVRPMGLFKQSAPITITVQLPMSGYIPYQVVSFAVKLKNGSNFDVQYVQFSFVQGFVFHAEQNTLSVDSAISDVEFVLKESSVKAGEEKAWNLALKVHPSLFIGNYTHSNVIKIFWELRGEVSLPFPHHNFTIYVPITLGSVPLAGKFNN